MLHQSAGMKDQNTAQRRVVVALQTLQHPLRSAGCNVMAAQEVHHNSLAG